MITINGRTPDEIKKVLECCYGNAERRLCEECPNAAKVEGYSEPICVDFDDSGENALAYIQRLERERDAAVKALRGDCRECAHRGKWDVCTDCIYFCPFEDEGKKDNWQWRGVQKEVE